MGYVTNPDGTVVAGSYVSSGAGGATEEQSRQEFIQAIATKGVSRDIGGYNRPGVNVTTGTYNTPVEQMAAEDAVRKLRDPNTVIDNPVLAQKYFDLAARSGIVIPAEEIKARVAGLSATASQEEITRKIQNQQSQQALEELKSRMGLPVYSPFRQPLQQPETGAPKLQLTPSETEKYTKTLSTQVGKYVLTPQEAERRAIISAVPTEKIQVYQKELGDFEYKTAKEYLAEKKAEGKFGGSEFYSTILSSPELVIKYAETGVITGAQKLRPVFEAVNFKSETAPEGMLSITKPLVTELYKASKPEAQENATREFIIGLAGQTKAYEGIGYTGAIKKFATESPVPSLIPIGAEFKIETMAAKYGLERLAAKAAGLAFDTEKINAISKTLGLTSTVLKTSAKLVEPAYGAYLLYPGVVDVAKSETLPKAIGKIAGFAVSIPGFSVGYGTPIATGKAIGEVSGLIREKTVTEAQMKPQIAYRSRAEVAELLLTQPEIKGVTSYSGAPKGEIKIRAPETIGDISAETLGYQGFWAAPTHGKIEPSGKYFLTKEYDLLRGIDIATYKTASELVPETLKTKIKEGIKAGKIEPSVYKQYLDIAYEKFKTTGEPIAVISPKTAKGISQPEAEMWLLGGKTGEIVKPLKITSSKFLGLSSEGAIIREVSIGKQVKVKSKGIPKQMLENIKFNISKQAHYLERERLTAVRKYGELYGGELSLPGTYGGHGKSHLEDVKSRIQEFKKTNVNLLEFSDKEILATARMHDITKIGERETSPYKHAEASAKLLEQGKLDMFPEISTLTLKEKINVAKAIREHTKIKPMTAILSGEISAPIKTLFRQPSELSKALATADRQSLARFGTKYDPNRGWNMNKTQLNQNITSKFMADTSGSIKIPKVTKEKIKKSEAIKKIEDSYYSKKVTKESFGKYKQSKDYVQLLGYNIRGKYTPISKYDVTSYYKPSGEYKPESSYIPISDYKLNSNYDPTGGYKPKGEYKTSGGYTPIGEYKFPSGYKPPTIIPETTIRKSPSPQTEKIKRRRKKSKIDLSKQIKTYKFKDPATELAKMAKRLNRRRK